MRRLLTMLLVATTMLAAAQVTTTPAIIEKGYKGEVTITFDPTGGNGGNGRRNEMLCTHGTDNIGIEHQQRLEICGAIGLA
ncbi:MAG: hypothetical protein IJS95_09410 [Prevotella sp.]|nr:hypothetical protein [Prevotella sp.]